MGAPFGVIRGLDLRQTSVRECGNLHRAVTPGRARLGELCLSRSQVAAAIYVNDPRSGKTVSDRLEDLLQELFVLLGRLRRATERNLDELSDLIETTDGTTSQSELQERWFAVNLERRRLDNVQSLFFTAWSEYRRLDVHLMRGDHSKEPRSDEPPGP